MTETTGRTTTTVFIRNVPVQVYRDIKADAARHGLTLKDWLEKALEARIFQVQARKEQGK